MINMMVPPALRDELERASAPFAESLRLEFFWPIPGPRILVGTVQVKDQYPFHSKVCSVRAATAGKNG